jgi:hypothetical protein
MMGHALGHAHGMGHARPHYHSFCSSCCHPVEACCCGCRECRKVPKELLVDPGMVQKTAPVKKLQTLEAEGAEQAPKTMTALVTLLSDLLGAGEESAPTGAAAEGTAERQAATPFNLESKEITEVSTKLPINTAALKRMVEGSAVIGGGCCVHLSVEYMPSNQLGVLSSAKPVALVGVGVLDSQGTFLAWGKLGVEGYAIKEDIITTNPGARLLVVALNAVARVRWCEVFSC